MYRKGKQTGLPFPYLDEGQDFPFPEVSEADENGLLCSGGNLSPGMLLSGYRRGIFPWFSEDEPILWWSPDPRFVLFTKELHVSDTMKKILRRYARGGTEAKTGSSIPKLSLCLDRDFPAVIRACSESPRKGQNGTWITEEMIEAYCQLHSLGYAHSVEAWIGDPAAQDQDSPARLVGGFYGVCLGGMFFGESMFSRIPDASKAAFIPFVWRLREEGFTLIDSQVYTDHLAGLGAREIPRQDYLTLLSAHIASLPAAGEKTWKGDWSKAMPDFPLSTEYRQIVLKENR